MLTLSQASGSISFVAIEGCPFETLDIHATPARPVIAWSTSPNSDCDSGTLPRGLIDRELQSIAARLKPGRIWGISQDPETRSGSESIDVPFDDRVSQIVAEDADGKMVAALIVGAFPLATPHTNALLEKRLQSSIAAASSAVVMAAPVSYHDAGRTLRSRGEQLGTSVYLDSLSARWAGLLRSGKKTRLKQIHAKLLPEGVVSRVGDWTLIGIPSEVDGAAALYLKSRWAGRHVVPISANSARAKRLTAGKIQRSGDEMVPNDLMDLIQKLEQIPSFSRKGVRSRGRGLTFETLQPELRTGPWLASFEKTAQWTVEGRNSNGGLLLKDGGAFVLSPDTSTRNVALSFWLSTDPRPELAAGDCVPGSLLTGFGMRVAIDKDCRLHFQDRPVDMRMTRTLIWHHFAAVRKGDAVSLFVDGKLLAARKSSGSTGDIAAERWRVQGNSAILLDDVRVFRRALSGANVKDIFRAPGDSGPPAPMDNPFPVSSTDPCVIRH
jgi:hypothetical protein